MSDHFGGGIYIGEVVSIGSKATLINCTISDNSSNLGGGAYCEENAILNVHNSIIYNNNLYEMVYNGHQPNVTYSNIKNGYPGIGNIDSYPLFNNPNIGDYHIQYTSPCRDAGDNAILPTNNYDMEGDPRKTYGIVDMGADEFHEHLYCQNAPIPGGAVQVNVIGTPGPTMIGLFKGKGMLDIPITTAYGDWFLDLPINLIRVANNIPASGFLTFNGNIPLTPPDKYFLQSIIGDNLSNLCIINVDK